MLNHRIAAPAFCLVLSLSACGGSDASEDAGARTPAPSAVIPSRTLPPRPMRLPEPEVLTLDEYRQEANAVCTRAKADAQALAPLPSSPSPAEIRAYFDKVLALSTQTREALSALTPPADIETEVLTEFIQPLSDQQNAARAVALSSTPEEAEKGKAEGAEAAQRIAAFAEKYGLPACIG